MNQPMALPQDQVFMQQIQQLGPAILYNPEALAEEAARRGAPPAQQQLQQQEPSLQEKLASVGAALQPVAPPSVNFPGQPGAVAPPTSANINAPTLAQMMQTALTSAKRPVSLGALLRGQP